MSQSLEQQRAEMAFNQVTKHAKNTEYRTAARKAPALIRSSGLCQALHFLHNKKGEGGKSVVQDLEVHLKKRGHIKVNILSEVRKTELQLYLIMTREVLSTLAWQIRAIETLKQD